MKPFDGVRDVKLIDERDFSAFVGEVYGRTYCYRQQDGCKERGVEWITVPDKYPYDYERSAVEERVNSHEMGVSFEAWLSRDPTTPLAGEEDHYEYIIPLWWERNFYPDLSMVINDLHSRGLLEAGTYLLNIDW